MRVRERVARLFLSELPDPIEIALQGLRSGDVTGFVVEQCREGRRGVAWAKTLTSGLRSLVVFLHVADWMPVALAGAVPSVVASRAAAPARSLR